MKPEYKKNGKTWTNRYDKWRRDNGVCNSPRAWALAMKEEKGLVPPCPEVKERGKAERTERSKIPLLVRILGFPR